MTQRLAYLDGLRGLLALIVFFHHFIYAFYPELIFGGNSQEYLDTTSFNIKKFFALTPLNLIFNPGPAIHGFFILSGYVQSWHYFESGNFVFLQKSFLKRYFRLAIPTLAVVILVFIFHRLNWLSKDSIPQNRLSDAWVKGAFPDNLGFFKVVLLGIFDSFYSRTSYYSVLWTMPYELYSSFMVLILLMITHLVKKKPLVFLTWLLVQLFLIRSFYGAAFTVGLLLAFLQQNKAWFKNLFNTSLAKWLCFIIGIYFASYPFTGYQDSAKNSVYGPISFFERYPHIISYLVGCSLIFCALQYTRAAQKILAHPVLLFFGKISFALYLIHFLIIFSLSPRLYHWFISFCTHSTSVMLSGFLSLVFVTALSWLFYRLVDAPALRWCNRKVDGLFSG